MKILICIKQVPDLEAGWFTGEEVLDRAGLDDKPQRMNRFDEYAVETALRLREAMSVARIDALTVGPPGAEEVVKRALGMGVDHGIRIDLAHEATECPYVTAGVIADYAAQRHYDLIFCGVMSEDLMQGQVGPVLAALLDLPWVGAVLEATPGIENGRMAIMREADGGRRENMLVPLPALLTVQTSAQAPRYPSLSHLVRANRQSVETVCVDSAARRVPRLRNVHFLVPPKTRQCAMLQGSPQNKARALTHILRARGFLGTPSR